MACKERQKDTDMLKVLAERNASRDIKTEVNFVDITWEGGILEVQFYVLNLENIISINRVSPGNYIATIMEETT